MRFSRVVSAALIVFAALLTATLWRQVETVRGATSLPQALEPFKISARPQDNRYLFDYADALQHYEEGAHRYLRNMVERFHIEALIVSVPTLPSGQSPSTLAADLVNRWRIGAANNGRGLLLLLVDDAKTVKLEVAYALEDVFTDAFTGYVEDLELGPYYRSGDLGTGLIAVLELLEQRAEMKHQGNYTASQISQADSQLLAGGAGAIRELTRYGENEKSAPFQSRGGARSPEEAWEIMLTQWGGAGADIDVDVYTAMSRRAMGDPNQADPRTLSALDHWRNADYQVLRDGDHAVIWFGAVDGWNNAPFLFCNTGEGWKFDIVHQRRLVVMSNAPHWQITDGPYPYINLMREARQTTSKDLPLSGDDLYRCSEDSLIHARMQQLEQELAQNPDSASATIELMRLSVITGRRPNLVQPLIAQARRLAPEAPEPHLYAAIYHVNSFFQYQTALAEIERYVELEPRAPVGHQIKGFLLYRLGRYGDSIDALKQALALDPADQYTYGLMARDYALLAGKARGSERRRLTDEAKTMRAKASTAATADAGRIERLTGWLKARLG